MKVSSQIKSLESYHCVSITFYPAARADSLTKFRDGLRPQLSGKLLVIRVLRRRALRYLSDPFSGRLAEIATTTINGQLHKSMWRKWMIDEDSTRQEYRRAWVTLAEGGKDECANVA